MERDRDRERWTHFELVLSEEPDFAGEKPVPEVRLQRRGICRTGRRKVSLGRAITLAFFLILDVSYTVPLCLYPRKTIVGRG